MASNEDSPIVLDVAALERIGGPIAAGLLPAWRVTWRVLPPEKLDALDPKLPGPNLAIVKSIPERRLAVVNVVTPWPPGESLSDTLHHEIGHAWIAPITAQIPDTPGSVMLEEQLIETLGVYLASLSEGARAAARKAIAPIVEEHAPRLRAKISARAAASLVRARGGQMDPKLIQEALDALISNDTAKCAEILKGLIAAAAGSGATPAPAPPAPASDPAPMGKEGAPEQGAPGAMAKEGDPDQGAPKDDANGRKAARKGAAIVTDSETLRVRKEAQEAADELGAMAKDQRKAAKETLVVGLRARLGASFTPAAEKRIMDAPNYQQAKALADFAEELGGQGGQRARSGQEPLTTPNVGGGTPAPFTAEQLAAEGIPGALADEIVEQHKTNPKLALNSLSHARARLNGGANPYMPTKPTAQQKVS